MSIYQIQGGSLTTFPVSVKSVVVRDGLVMLLKNWRDEWELPGERTMLQRVTDRDSQQFW